jgi:biopolymer transport protein ExbD
MAFGRLDKPASGQPMADINMTPLIDVMLVLLVIFIITAPLLAGSVKLDLPTAQAGPAEATPRFVTVQIDREGTLYLNDAPVSAAQMRSALRDRALASPDTEIRLRADTAVPYGKVAAFMADAQAAGLNRIGFVTQNEAPSSKP